MFITIKLLVDVPLLIPLFLKSLIKIAVAISPTSYSYLFPPSIYFGTLFVSFHLLYNIELQINFTIATILLSNTHCSNIHNIIAVISTTNSLFFSYAHADDSRLKHRVQCVCIKNTIVLTLSDAGVCIFGMRKKP